MPDRSRIPRLITRFNPYIINTSAYLVAGDPSNAVRLGLLPAELSKWIAFFTKWRPLYADYSDERSKRTTAIKDELRSIIRSCIKHDQTCHILDRIAVSANVTIRDMETFNIKRGFLQKTVRTVPRKEIEESVSASIQMIGGGSVVIKCHSSKGSRAAIFAEADTVQYSYLVGDTAPTSAEQKGLTREMSSRASLILSLGTDSSPKYLYIYFRWYRTKYPLLSGPWSNLQTSLIL